MCNHDCDNNEQRYEIFEILKDFKCLDKIRNKIKEKYNAKSHFKEITSLISKEKEMIYYGGPQSCINEDALNKEYIHNKHSKYWLNIKDDNEVEPFNYTHCLCFHCIKNLCYIKNIKTKKIYVVGNECVNKFVDKDMQGRRCNICKTSHKNIKDNYCNECRKNIKDELKKEKEEKKRAQEKEISERYYQEYLKKKEIENENEFRKGGICKFGKKHKGTLYVDIFNNDKGYIKWALDTYKTQQNELGYIKKDNIYYLLKLYQEFIKH